jgi:hypothetical protein
MPVYDPIREVTKYHNGGFSKNGCESKYKTGSAMFLVDD